MFKGECETVYGEIMFHKCVVGMFTSESETLYNVQLIFNKFVGEFKSLYDSSSSSLWWECLGMSESKGLMFHKSVVGMLTDKS